MSAPAIWRVSEEVGSTRASAGVSARRSAGEAIASSTAEVSSATVPGRRMTARASRAQPPSSSAAAARAAPRCIHLGESESMRGPSAISTAGSTTSETAPAISATIVPPTPIE